MIKPHLITTPYKIFKKILKRKEKKPMKTGKKILALALVALMLTVAMNFTAFAATIDVDGAYKNETYNAYKILEYTSNTTIPKISLTAQLSLQHCLQASTPGRLQRLLPLPRPAPLTKRLCSTTCPPVIGS